jgi:hypothetical protein
VDQRDRRRRPSRRRFPQLEVLAAQFFARFRPAAQA